MLSLFFPAPLAVEVLKVEADGRYLALVQARLDPQTLSESWMRSYNGLERAEGKGQLPMVVSVHRRARRASSTPGCWVRVAGGSIGC